MALPEEFVSGSATNITRNNSSVKKGYAFPATQVRTSHTLSIRVGGKVIGMIQSWAPSQSRSVVPYYEINSVTNGGICENIPGVASGLSVSITRYDLYTEHMEQVWGSNFDITMLTDQTNPLQVSEKWYDQYLMSNEKDDLSNPESISGAVKKGWSTVKNGFKDLGKELRDPRKWSSPKASRVYLYDGFWFTSLGRRLEASGNRIVSVNATAVYTRVSRAN